MCVGRVYGSSVTPTGRVLLIIDPAVELKYPHLCKHCWTPIWLQLQTLSHMLRDQDSQTIEAPAIVFACPRCKQVQTLQPDEFVPGNIGRVESDPPDTFCAWLACKEKSCKIQLPLYGQWSASTTEKERLADARTWVWDGLTCPEGHAIRKPSD